MFSERSGDAIRAAEIKPLSVKGSGHLLDPDRRLALTQSGTPRWGRGQEPAAWREAQRYASAPAGGLGQLGTLSSGRFSSGDGLSSLLSAREGGSREMEGVEPEV